MLHKQLKVVVTSSGDVGPGFLHCRTAAEPRVLTVLDLAGLAIEAGEAFFGAWAAATSWQVEDGRGFGQLCVAK